MVVEDFATSEKQKLTDDVDAAVAKEDARTHGVLDICQSQQCLVEIFKRQCFRQLPILPMDLHDLPIALTFENFCQCICKLFPASESEFECSEHELCGSIVTMHVPHNVCNNRSILLGSNTGDDRNRTDRGSKSKSMHADTRISTRKCPSHETVMRCLM